MAAADNETDISLEMEQGAPLDLGLKFEFDDALPSGSLVTGSVVETVYPSQAIPTLLSDSTVLRFRFDQSVSWLCFGSASLVLRFRLLSAEGRPLDTEHLVCCLNSPGTGIIQKVTLSANGAMDLCSWNHYNYLSYVLSLLRYSASYQNTLMKACQMWIPG